MSVLNVRVRPARARFPQRWLAYPSARPAQRLLAASTRSGTGEQEPRARSRRRSLSPGASVYTDLTDLTDLTVAAAAAVYLYARSPRTVFFL